ncbi:2OG-Fe(II) oxygenase [Rhodocaloribacter litoris]|uniref:2OG-Fe(II) oxygenase n=1 Tax=Rhodocaloribacter litoris TaxID=2558931 RepID=UPI00141DFD9E|nr:2OG-Fe(II) oxygenase [Rhodocaloribacter litoris]QXD15013.1 2OG-Fe(II) oxygenase [Rhodocaloribacter litoris]
MQAGEVQVGTVEAGAVCEAVVQELVVQGWSVRNDVVPAEVVGGLIRTAQAAWEAGDYHRAGVGQGAERAVRPEVRSDRILWLDPAALPPAVVPYWDIITRLRDYVNRTLYLGLRDFEAHFAVYPPGSFYKKHLDQFAATRHRMLTCLLYLNVGWRPEEAGQLRLYPEAGAPVDVWPEAGTFVCFRSDTIYHEVLPTRRERLSLTGWLRRPSVF